jgi:hypothetical protein
MAQGRRGSFFAEHVRPAVFSAAIGVAIATILGLGRSHPRWGVIFMSGAVVGIAIWISVDLLELLFRPAINRQRQSIRGPLHALLFAIGGMPWLVWGVCVRVTIGVSMHWFVGYICHTHGPQSWLVNNGAVQAHNVPWAAIPSMGESWHNNHHAFPASARHGLYPGQVDLGFYFIRLLERLGLAWDVRTPASLPARSGITPVTPEALNAPGIRSWNLD